MQLYSIPETLSVVSCAQIHLRGCYCGEDAQILSENKLSRLARTAEQCMCVLYAAHIPT